MTVLFDNLFNETDILVETSPGSDRDRGSDR